MQKENFEKLKSNPTLRKYAVIDHDLIKKPEILEKLIRRENSISNNVNISQPSHEFMRQTYKDTNVYFEKQKELINEISPNPVFSLRNLNFEFNL